MGYYCTDDLKEPNVRYEKRGKSGIATYEYTLTPLEIDLTTPWITHTKKQLLH